MVQMKKAFEDEKKLKNNIGVMYQRQGDHAKAAQCFGQGI
jgi:hypothetical protein